MVWADLILILFKGVCFYQLFNLCADLVGRQEGDGAPIGAEGDCRVFGVVEEENAGDQLGEGQGQEGGNQREEEVKVLAAEHLFGLIRR